MVALFLVVAYFFPLTNPAFNGIYGTLISGLILLAIQTLVELFDIYTLCMLHNSDKDRVK